MQAARSNTATIHLNNMKGNALIACSVRSNAHLVKKSCGLERKRAINANLKKRMYPLGMEMISRFNQTLKTKMLVKLVYLIKKTENMNKSESFHCIIPIGLESRMIWELQSLGLAQLLQLFLLYQIFSFKMLPQLFSICICKVRSSLILQLKRLLL